MNANKVAESTFKEAAEVINEAEAILVGAGAGFGVDSGLPDFRGKEGFWKAYPKAKELNLDFFEMANPQTFAKDPWLAWGFYGHRYNLYRNTLPHAGFQILKKWFSQKPYGGFVFTSNVDGHFQKAGFSESEVVECHGSINHWQCCKAPHGIWDAPDHDLSIDESKLLLEGELPRCDECGFVARPNILMFGDYGWDGERTDEQMDLCYEWLRSAPRDKLVTIEVGAGTAISSVRDFCSGWGRRIRINPAEGAVSGNDIGIAMPALEALSEISKLIDN